MGHIKNTNSRVPCPTCCLHPQAYVFSDKNLFIQPRMTHCSESGYFGCSQLCKCSAVSIFIRTSVSQRNSNSYLDKFSIWLVRSYIIAQDDGNRTVPFGNPQSGYVSQAIRKNEKILQKSKSEWNLLLQ